MHLLIIYATFLAQKFSHPFNPSLLRRLLSSSALNFHSFCSCPLMVFFAALTRMHDLYYIGSPEDPSKYHPRLISWILLHRLFALRQQTPFADSLITAPLFNLPDDCLFVILAKLDVISLCNVSMTCKKLYNLVLLPVVWNSHPLRELVPRAGLVLRDSPPDAELCLKKGDIVKIVEGASVNSITVTTVCLFAVCVGDYLHSCLQSWLVKVDEFLSQM